MNFIHVLMKFNKMIIWRSPCLFYCYWVAYPMKPVGESNEVTQSPLNNGTRIYIFENAFKNVTVVYCRLVTSICFHIKM
jgi:hypothetical protein